MKRPTIPRGERELDVLEALWGLKRPAAVGEVRDALERRGLRLAYTTVQTMLNRLEAKQVVTRDERARAHLYSARLVRGATVRAALGAMVLRFFKGSPESLAAHLVDSELSAEALERLSRAIEARRLSQGRSRKP